MPRPRRALGLVSSMSASVPPPWPPPPAPPRSRNRAPALAPDRPRCCNHRPRPPRQELHMHRFVFAAILALAAFPAIAQQTAGEVFQWTDANGVTHYSQTPPTQGGYEHRLITSSGAAAPTASE